MVTGPTAPNSPRRFLRRLCLLAAGGATLPGCAVEEWRNADLQIDVTGAGLSDEAQMRVCVADVGIHEQAMGGGRLSFPGIPPASSVTVTVEAIDSSGERRLSGTAPITLTDTAPYSTVIWTDCSDECTACQADGSLAADTAESWLLAVRFQDQE